MIERRASMLRRLAMLFALCDLTMPVASPSHRWALAWVRYSVESVKFVFASAADDGGGLREPHRAEDREPCCPCIVRPPHIA